MPANLEDARRLLGDGALFRKLAPNDRDSLVARAHIRSFGAGDTIFRMGDLHDNMIAILDGEVRISIPSADGKELVLAIVYAGDVFGEIAMLDGKPRSADATALTACTLAVLDRRNVLAALGRNPDAWLGLMEVLCSRLRRTDHHLVELANRVGAARESVNKCFQEWRRAGIVRTDKRVITIVDRTALEALVEPE